MVINQAAPPDKEMKYARHEHERRFLLAELPAGHPIRTVAIHDRYITNTRLRLRRWQQTKPSEEAPVFKLTQKVPAASGGSGLITNTYLCESEYDVFATLPAAALSKTRHSIAPLGVDVFAGELAGLLLAEIEFDTAEELQSFAVPEFAVAEVTGDPRFTGGQLAVTDARGVRDALSSFGL